MGNTIGKLIRIEHLLKHLPGRHPQQRHAGSRAEVAALTGSVPEGWQDVMGDGTYIARKQGNKLMQVWLAKDSSSWKASAAAAGKPVRTHTEGFPIMQQAVDWAESVEL